MEEWDKSRNFSTEFGTLLMMMRRKEILPMTAKRSEAEQRVVFYVEALCYFVILFPWFYIAIVGCS